MLEGMLLTTRAMWACAALVVGGCGAGGPDPAGDDPVPDASGPPVDGRPLVDAGPGVDAPPALIDPAAPGPWLAGVRTVEVTDPARNRRFSVDVWYPVDPANVDGRANSYRLDSILGSLAEIDSPARRDATPAAGARPLILFSHGYGGIRFQSYFLTEHLARHGFVVAAPDHPGNTLTDFLQLGNDDATAQSAIDRPLDLLRVLDRALAGNLGVTVDGARVGATGHSFGGWTALEVARRDPRIGAAFSLAPGFRNGATSDFVADLARPILLVGGSEDRTCPFTTDQEAPYQIAARPRYLLEVMGAGHLDFSNLCEVPLAAQLVDDGCDPASIDPAVVHQRVLAVATAFALHHVAGHAGYQAYLDAGHVGALANVRYWADP